LQLASATSKGIFNAAADSASLDASASDIMTIIDVRRRRVLACLPGNAPSSLAK